MRYSYPLVQYKCLNGQAALLCVGDGCEAAWDFFYGAHFDLTLGHREIHLCVEDILRRDTQISLTEENTCRYHASWYLPFNSDNLNRYNTAIGLSDQISILESILKGNILSMLKGCGVQLDGRIILSITFLSTPYPVTFKGLRLLSFECEFSTNISLPPHIGIGRHVSIGFGTLYRI